MSRSLHLLALGAVMLGLSGCRGPGKSEGAPESSAAPGPPAKPPPRGENIGPPRISRKCILPLEQYCQTPPCPTYESALREAVQAGSQPSSMGVCVAREGVCGSVRFVTSGDGYSSATGFFDDSGRLVGGLRGSDTNSFCGGESFTAFYGEPLSCNQIVTQDYCKAPAP